MKGRRPLPATILAELVEALPDGLVVADPLGRIALLNAQAARLLGYEREELIGQPVEMLVPEVLREIHADQRCIFQHEPTARAMGTGRELVVRRRDGAEVPVEISLSPVITDRGVLVCACIRDIRDRRRRELEVVRAERLLAAARDDGQPEDAHRQDELDHVRERRRAAQAVHQGLVASVAHELRTPLGAILGFAELVHRDRRHPVNEVQRRRLQRLMEAAEQLRMLVDDVLDFGRRKPGRRLARVDLPAVGWPPRSAPASAGDRSARDPILVYVDADGAHVALMAELVGEVGQTRLLAATTLEQGIATALAARADLVLVDVDAPGMVERDPAARVRQACTGGAIPVVGVTAPGAARAHPRGLLAGFDRLLHRPVAVDDLARLLEELIPQRS